MFNRIKEFIKSDIITTELGAFWYSLSLLVFGVIFLIWGSYWIGNNTPNNPAVIMHKVFGKITGEPEETNIWETSKTAILITLIGAFFVGLSLPSYKFFVQSIQNANQEIIAFPSRSARNRQRQGNRRRVEHLELNPVNLSRFTLVGDESTLNSSGVPLSPSTSNLSSIPLTPRRPHSPHTPSNLGSSRPIISRDVYSTDSTRRRRYLNTDNDDANNDNEVAQIEVDEIV